MFVISHLFLSPDLDKSVQMLYTSSVAEGSCVYCLESSAVSGYNPVDKHQNHRLWPLNHIHFIITDIWS